MTESQIQTAIINYLDCALSSQFFAFHVPNGAKRDKITAARLKREGVRAGVPDIVILRNGGLAAFMEVKTDKGRLSPQQRDFRDWCAENRFDYAVVRSVSDAEDALRAWGLIGKRAA